MNRFEVVFITRRRTYDNSFLSKMSGLQLAADLYESKPLENQYPEENGLHALDRYREVTGDNDVTIEDMDGIEFSMWSDKDSYTVPISEEVARASGRFAHRRNYKCWCSHEVLVEYETKNLSEDGDNDKKIVDIALDLDKVLEGWIAAGYPQEWYSISEKDQ